jgi:hypothetical protein
MLKQAERMLAKVYLLQWSHRLSTVEMSFQFASLGEQQAMLQWSHRLATVEMSPPRR